MTDKPNLTASELNKILVDAGRRFFGERVLIARHKKIRKVGSIHIAESAQRENQYGSIVMIGEHPLVQEMNLKVGDVVYIGKFGAADIRQRVGDRTYWMGVLHRLDVMMAHTPRDEPELEEGDLKESIQ